MVGGPALRTARGGKPKTLAQDTSATDRHAEEANSGSMLEEAPTGKNERAADCQHGSHAAPRGRALAPDKRLHRKVAVGEREKNGNVYGVCVVLVAVLGRSRVRSRNATLCDNCCKAVRSRAQCKTTTYCSNDCQVHTAHTENGAALE